MSTPTNKEASLVNAGLAALLDILKRYGAAGARASYPWLNWPIVSQLFSWLTNVLEKWLYDLAATQASFIVINFQTNAERDAYLKSLEELVEARESGIHRKEALEKVKKNVKDLIRFNGVVIR